MNNGPLSSRLHKAAPYENLQPELMICLLRFPHSCKKGSLGAIARI